MDKSSTKPKVLVIGSFMMDLVVRTPRVPENGETVIGKNFQRFPGGKGANQAVAAAKLGADVTMVGKVGADWFGDDILQVLEANGVDIEHILRDSAAPTGVGSVTIDELGNNRIVVVPGANLKYDLDDLKGVESLFGQADIVLLQLEMDIRTIKAAVEIGAMYNVPVILNPAPAQQLDEDLLSKVSYLTPNESEAELLTGVKISDVQSAEAAASKLLAMGVSNVVITLGDKGALYANADGSEYVPGFRTKVIDTVAAGDAFNGGLAVALTQGQSLGDAVKFANAVGALAVTKEGAIPSLPNRGDVDKFMDGEDLNGEAIGAS